jgi:AcrR family transcriptional regulator
MDETDYSAQAPGAGRSARSAHTRDQIVAAAARLFERNGYGATSMEDIAAEADVSKATVYYQFPNKETLYTWICVNHATRAMKYVEQVESSTLTAAEKVVELVWDLVASTMHEATVRLLYDSHAHISANSREVIRASQHRYVDALERAIIGAQQAGDAFPDDAKLIALAIFESIGRTRHWFDPRGRLPAKEAGPAIVRMFLRSVLEPSALHVFEDRVRAAGSEFFAKRANIISLVESGGG